MAKRGGYPGMPKGMDMGNLMKQAQKMQRQVQETQKELEEKTYEASAGGGVVNVTVAGGSKEIVAVKIAEEVVDPDDIEMLEDLIMAAANEALRAAQADETEKMSKFTGGFGGGLGGLF